MAVRLARAGFCYCAVLLGRAREGERVKRREIAPAEAERPPGSATPACPRPRPWSAVSAPAASPSHRAPPSTQHTSCTAANAWENTSLHPGVPSAQQPATASSTFSTSSPGSSAHPPAVTVFCRCPRARYRNGFVESAARRPSARPHARGPRPHPSLRLGGTRNVTVACDGGAGAQAGVRHRDGRTPRRNRAQSFTRLAKGGTIQGP
jgi:hypothetical protein